MVWGDVVAVDGVSLINNKLYRQANTKHKGVVKR